MNVNTRALVAYIAARHVTGQNTSCIRDKQHGAYVMFTGSMGAEAINIHDHQARCQITGTRREGHYELKHEGRGTQLVVDFDGPNFTGYAADSDEQFSGVVNGRDVTVEDAAGRFEYSL